MNRILAALLTSSALITAPAQAAVMSFDYTGTLGDYAPIPQTEGDLPGLDVTGSTRAGFGDSAEIEGHVEYWETGYASPTLVGVAFASQNGRVAQFAFDPDPGLAVTLSSFDIGTYFNGPALTGTATIYDASWNELWTTGSKTWSGAAETETPNVTSTGVLYLQLGTNWNIGIDNIVYDVTQASPVPAPATPALLLAAIVGLFLGRRSLA